MIFESIFAICIVTCHYFMPYRQLFLTTVDSTNLYLQRLQQSGESISNIIVSTDFQSNGRGLERNNWFSGSKTNLLFSVGVDVHFLPAVSQFLITQAVSTAIIAVLEKLFPIQNFSIKWPNDIYFENKKLAGILISNTVIGNCLNESIIGVGLNVNEEVFPKDLPNPISLFQIANKKFKLPVLLKQFAEAIFHSIESLKDSEQIGLLEDRYLNNLFRYMKWHSYIVDGKVIRAKIVGHNEYGHLLLEDESKNVFVCDLKQVKFVL